ncbi:MAG: biopolymer transporter ExbD [Kiritimatiellae bacterium]|nr:biopolymer transporter ExbD [Kiritimatiellia bacterium]
MARHTALTSLKQISEINMTPLIDLTFLLLITFIITFPLLEQGIPVNLPRGKAEELDSKDTRTISIDLQGVLYLDDIRITPEELAREMTMLGQAQPDITIFVRADEGIKYGRLVEVLSILHDAKIARMALVTQAEKQGKP